MTAANPKQRSAPEDGQAVDRNVVLLSAFGLRHPSSCGERVACPRCGEPDGPLYRPAERFARQHGSFIYCNRCREGWREIGAAA